MKVVHSSVSLLCVPSLCLLPVSLLCASPLWLFSVPLLCVISLCLFSVSLLCVSSPCPFSVPLLCVTSLCLSSVSLLCVTSLCHFSVSLLCVSPQDYSLHLESHYIPATSDTTANVDGKKTVVKRRKKYFWVLRISLWIPWIPALRTVGSLLKRERRWNAESIGVCVCRETQTNNS